MPMKLKNRTILTWMYEVSQKLHDNVYVTIDLDVFDSLICRRQVPPEPDGLTYADSVDFAQTESANAIISSGLVFVELCPNDINKAPSFLASKLIYQILSIRFKQ